MTNLRQKVLEIQKQNGHTNEDIRASVNIEIKRLQKLYRSESERAIVEDKYKSSKYKSLMGLTTPKTATYMATLLKQCLLDETNINNFINGDTERIQDKSKDFFAVYCGCEGYNDFIVKFKKVSYIKDATIQLKTESRTVIYGATIIDEEFIQKVKSGKSFSMAEFYGAKQNNNCQWYGIINDFDVIREGYDKLKKTVLHSFIEEKDGKVSAIVHGTGGSGKSTVLRRLAIDLFKESFDVVWLEKDGVEEFVRVGLSIIQNEVEKDESRKFLIFIEDWYRIFDDENKTKLGTKILEDTKKTNKVRIIIGDREIKKQYKIYQNNNYELLLSSNDNKEIVKKIIEKYPHWELASEKLFEKEKNYEFSLFLLLFILARINQKELNKESIDLYEPQQIFQNIIESDIKFIFKSHVGLAKALYYWGCFYAKHKIFITYETFLKIADFYNGKSDSEISDLFSRWNIKDDVLDKLKIYINRENRKDKINGLYFVQFNHDILIDIGINNLYFDDFEKFSDKTKIELLNIITDIGDDYSASKFLGTLLRFEEQIFKDQNEKISFVKKLISKNNKETFYLHVLSQLKLDDNTLTELAYLLWSKKIDYSVFWGIYFRQVRNINVVKDDIPEILNIESFSKYDTVFIQVVMSHSGNLKERKDFILQLLSGDNYKIIHPFILQKALSYAEFEQKQFFIKKLLQDHSWIQLYVSNHLFNEIDSFKSILILGCLELADFPTANEFSNFVLKNYDLTKTDLMFIEQCVVFASTDVKNLFLKNIFETNYWRDYKNFNSVLGYTKYLSDNEKGIFFKKVLLDDEYEIIKKFFDQCRKYHNKKISDLFIKIAIDNKEGKHPNVVRDILFMEDTGLGGYL